MTVQEIRNEFPILSREVYSKPLVYFDNAATSQRPRCVVDKFTSLSLNENANIHRAFHRLAVDATEEYEQTRRKVAEYLGCSEKEIVFTSGTTNSINLVAFSFGEAFVKEGDEIIVSESEHHSNIVPWQMLCSRKGAKLRVIPVDDDGYLRLDVLESLLSDKTKIVAVTHISNVLGLVNPIPEIVSVCHERGVPVLVDGAQGIIHQNIDIQELGCDFYALSGHKMFASTGTGVLYGKSEWLDKMPPYMGGGEMINSVSFSGTTYAPVPGKFEAGTQNINATPTLVPAFELLSKLNNDAETTDRMKKVTRYLLDYFLSDPRITLYGIPKKASDKIPLFSFTVKGAHHEDIAILMDKMGIALRSGQMCAEPLMDRFATTGMVRASLAHYNTMEEAEYFVACLDKAIKMLTK